MSGYTKKENEEFDKTANEMLKLYEKKKKPKKLKRKRGLKKGVWRG